MNYDVALLLGVSDLEVHDASETPDDAEQFNDGSAVKVEQAAGEVCARCRMTKEDVGSDDAYPQLCARCAKIVRENFPETVTEGLEK